MHQSSTQVVELATNLDDVPGEQVAAAAEALRHEGALDVWTTPITMKKGRPAVLLTALAEPGDRDRLSRRMIELTGTFGVRSRTWDRLVLQRRQETVSTSYGALRLKVGTLAGRIVAAKCEYDDARRLAEQHGVDVAVVLASGRAEAHALVLRDRDQPRDADAPEHPAPPGERLT